MGYSMLVKLDDYKLPRNFLVNNVPSHNRHTPKQCCWFELDNKHIGRSVVVCDAWTNAYYKSHMLSPNQAYFRLLSNISQQQILIKIDCLSGKVFFMRDYDLETSGWDRGHRGKLVINDEVEFKSQFSIFD